jgi:hypothetical protein
VFLGVTYLGSDTWVSKLGPPHIGWQKSKLMQWPIAKYKARSFDKLASFVNSYNNVLREEKSKVRMFNSGKQPSFYWITKWQVDKTTIGNLREIISTVQLLFMVTLWHSEEWHLEQH